jgi:steroid delta-isomerase-like uncharacterized protein
LVNQKQLPSTADGTFVEKSLVEKKGRILMSEHNKALMRRAVEEVWNRQDFAALKEIVADDFVIHASTPEAEIHGVGGAKQFVMMLHSAIPDIHFTIVDQVAEGDRVVTRWKAHGTHKGELMGMPPTGKQLTLTATDIDRIANGKIVECWTTMDGPTMLQQMSLMPASGQAT